MPQPEVRDYNKKQLRVILANPNIDTSDPAKLELSKYKQSKKHFQKEVYPVVEQHCPTLISLDTFKKIKIIPKKVVKVLFEKLL